MAKFVSALILATVLLPVALPTAASVTVVEDRLDIDAMLWANARMHQTAKEGWAKARFDLYRRALFLGVTGHLSDVARLRMYIDVADIAGSPAFDLYADFTWPSGFGLRAGQFKPPLGFEALTPTPDLKFIEYSAVSRFWKPGDARDIGVMVSYEGDWFGVALAGVNGNGRNMTADDNQWKDAVGRVILRPLERYGVVVALRGYYGRLGGDADLDYRNVAVELKTGNGPFEAVAEGQTGIRQYRDGDGNVVDLGRSSFYVQSSYAIGLVEPVARCDVEFQHDDKFDVAATAGLNFQGFDERLRVMVNYRYWHKDSNTGDKKGTSNTLLLQLQAGI